MSKQAGLTGFEIAIIGMAGRFPAAKNIEEYWENLVAGKETISFFNDGELLETGVDPGILADPNYVKAYAILEDIEYFDSSFFGYTDAEAAVMDPQIRIFHECAWNCLEDAGCYPSTYNGLIGLYVGASPNFYWEALTLLSPGINMLGADSAELLMKKDFLGGWVAYKLDLKGPAFTLSTACSTSLVAIHEACQAVLNGECDMALAGGVSVSPLNKTGYMSIEDGPFSTDGHVRAFDAGPHGIMGGSGAAVVLLKRLEDALRDRDHIYAVIKGSAINNDGVQKAGFTAPSINGQARVIKAALEMAEVEPESIGYIETHGTATELGDSVEIRALTLAFNTDKRQYCRIGSVKTNIAHLDAAAGAAGLIKAVLCIKHGLIPPSLHFERPNPDIDFQNTPFYVNAELSPWKDENKPLRAGVSSFGLGGTNAHVILEEAPPAEPSSQSRSFQLLLLSAKTRDTLDKMTKNLGEYLKKNLLNHGNHENPINPGPILADAAYTLQTGRKSLQYRRCLVAPSLEVAIPSLCSPAGEGMEIRKAADEKPSLVLMLSGQGAIYVNMGLDLYTQEPQFRQELDHGFSILESLSGINCKDMLYPSPEEPGTAKKKMGDPRYNGALTLLFEYSLAKLIMKWGLEPRALIGYSFGEYTAASLSGVFSLQDVLKLALQRGEMMLGMPVGSMMSVSLPEQELKHRLPDDISIAAVNGPEFCIVSGPPQPIKRLRDELRTEGHDAYRLRVPRAGHSQMMLPFKDELIAHFEGIPLHTPKIPYISGLTGNWITSQQAASPQYWARHMTETIRFYDGIGRILSELNPIFVQVGSERALPLYVGMHPLKKEENLAMNLIRYEKEKDHDVSFLLNRIGELWQCGLDIDWKDFYANEKRSRISLPTYSFKRTSYPLPGNINKIAVGKIPGNKKEILPPSLSQDGNTGAEREKTSTVPIKRKQTRKNAKLSAPYVPPRDETEQKLVEIFQSFFSIEPVGIHDDFYDLGGDSLRAVQLTGLIKKSGSNITLSIKDLLFYQNIHDICQGLKTQEKIGTKKASESIEIFLSKKYDTHVYNRTYRLNDNAYRVLFIAHKPFDIQKVLEDITAAAAAGSVDVAAYPNYVAFTEPGGQEPPKNGEIHDELLSKILGLKHRISKKDRRHMDKELNRNKRLSLLLKKNTMTREYEVSPIQTTYLVPPYVFVKKEFANYYTDFTHPVNMVEVRKLALAVIQRNSLFRSVIIERKGKHFIREYDSFSNIYIPFLDLSSYSPACREKVIDHIRSYLNQSFEVLDRPLYRIVILKMDHTNWALILRVNHLIGDGACVGILDDQFHALKHGIEKPQNRSTTMIDYFDYVNFLKNQDYQYIGLDKYVNFQDFRRSNQAILKKYKTAAMKYESFEVDISIIREAFKDYYNEIAFLAYAKSIGDLFGTDKVPILYLTNGRVYKDANFSYIIGDFHDNIPVLFPLDEEPRSAIERFVDYKRFVRDNNFNFMNYMVKGYITHPQDKELASPFSFNSLIGSYDFFKKKSLPERKVETQKLTSPVFLMLLLENYSADKLWVSFLQNSGFTCQEIFMKNFTRLVDYLEKKS